MGTLSLDLNMTRLAENFLTSLKLTEHTYGVILDRYGTILALSEKAQEVFFNDTVREIIKRKKGCTSKWFGNAAPAFCREAAKPLNIADAYDGIHHSGTNLSVVIDEMFSSAGNCSSQMLQTTLMFPKRKEFTGDGESPEPETHIVVQCRFGSVPGWGLLIGTEYPDITDAASIKVQILDQHDNQKVTVADNTDEHQVTSKFQFSGEWGLSRYPDQDIKIEVTNTGRVAIPLRTNVEDTAHEDFLVVQSPKSHVLEPNSHMVVIVRMSVAGIQELGLYTGTVYIQADRREPRGICLSQPIKLRVQAKVKEANVVRVLKSLALLGFVPLILIVLAKITQYYMKKHYKNEAIMSKMIDEAVGSVDKIEHPMVIMSAASFKRLGRLVSHEQAQELHEAIWLYTAKEVKEFTSRYRVVFISHQWTGFDLPDPTQTQYEAMVMSLETLRVQKHWEEADMYVWVDYSSIPQRHRGTQLLAINSLTVYASNVSAFVVVAPHVVHKDLHEVCDKSTYQCRAWCRAEQLSHLLVCGTANMYLAERGVLTPLTSIRGWLEQSTYVFHGDLTCCRRLHEGMTRCDKEFLVTPMLGLWAQLCLRVEDMSRDVEPVEDVREAITIHHAIRQNLDEIFPRTFRFVDASGIKERQLFGNLTDRLCAALSTHLEDQARDAKA